MTVRLFAPFGSTRPVPIAADLAVEALAPLSAAREQALVEELGAMVVVGSTDVETIWLERSYHVAPLDYDAPVIFERSAEFITKRTKG